jgi:2-dehydro-3-deoxygluconokinase
MPIKVVTFGELMLRLTPPNYGRFSQSKSFNIYYGGAEANVAATLAQLGINACFTTKLPLNDIGKSAANYCSSFSINTEHVVYGGERLGIYFCEDGISQRPSSIIYDRKNSSIATANESDFNWDNILSDAALFHYTGITAGLSENVRVVLFKALKTAKKKNILVSCDLNYRTRLWSKEEANKIMTEYMKYTDILIANEEDAEKVFNISSGSNVEAGNIDIEGYKKVGEELFKRFQLKLVASHLRESRSATDNGWQVILYDGKDFAISKKYNIHVLDRVGAGDAFVGGLIYCYLHDKNLQDTAEFAAASGCLKHSIHGDFNIVNITEIENLAKSSGAGRVKR